MVSRAVSFPPQKYLTLFTGPRSSTPKPRFRSTSLQVRHCQFLNRVSPSAAPTAIHRGERIERTLGTVLGVEERM